MSITCLILSYLLCASTHDVDSRLQQCKEELQNIWLSSEGLSQTEMFVKASMLQAYIDSFTQQKSKEKQNTSAPKKKEQPTVTEVIDLPQRPEPAQKNTDTKSQKKPQEKTKKEPTKPQSLSSTTPKPATKEPVKNANPSAKKTTVEKHSSAKNKKKETQKKPSTSEPVKRTVVDSNKTSAPNIKKTATPSKVVLEEFNAPEPPKPPAIDPMYSHKIIQGNVLKKYGISNSTLPAPFNQKSGVTFMAPGNSPVFAPTSGTVVLCQTIYNNKLVIIQHHDNYFTAIFGLHHLSIQPQDTVAAGTVIGHLPTKKDALIYVEVRRNEEIVDPTDWLTKWWPSAKAPSKEV